MLLLTLGDVEPPFSPLLPSPRSSKAPFGTDGS